MTIKSQIVRHIWVTSYARWQAHLNNSALRMLKHITKVRLLLTYMKSPIMRFPSLHVKVWWLKLSDLKQHLLSDLLPAIKQESALYFLFNIWLSCRYFPQFYSNNILNLQHYSSSRPEARSLEKGIKQAWFKRESHCLQGPGSQCDGVRFVMLDGCLVNHTPTPWLHPEQSSADHWCGCTAGQDTAKHLPFTS